MAQKKYDTTAEHFEYFKQRVDFWQKKLGATCYSIFCVHEKDGKNTMASFQKWDDIARIKINLNLKTDVPPTTDELDVAAFHEVFEAIYLSTLRGLAKTSWSEYEVEQATHKAVAMATSSIFKTLRQSP